MVFILSSHMVSFLISVSPQLLPIQWKISDTFKIKKPVKSLRGEVIFAIIKLIKNRRLSLAQGRAASKHVLNGSPAQIGPRGASLFLRSESSSISTAAGGSTSAFRPYCYALRPLFFCKEVFLS